MFEGRLSEDEPGHVRIACAELDAPVYVDHGISAAANAAVCAAIRPEKIHLSADAPAARDNTARGVVEEISYLGETSIYLVRLVSGKIVRVTQPNIRRHERDNFARGQQVFLSWEPSSPVVMTQ